MEAHQRLQHEQQQPIQHAHHQVHDEGYKATGTAVAPGPTMLSALPSHLLHVSPLNSLSSSNTASLPASGITSPLLSASPLNAVMSSSPFDYDEDDLTINDAFVSFDPELQHPDEVAPNTVEMRVRVERRMLEYVLQGNRCL